MCGEKELIIQLNIYSGISILQLIQTKKLKLRVTASLVIVIDTY